MQPITFHAVSDVDFDAFTAAFNLAYQDYYVPIIMTSESFRSIMERDDLSITASVAAMDGERIVGTGLLGIRASVGWIGGMGVIPDYRRQGIGRQMMHYLIEQARVRALTTLKLEVIEANEGAHALYRELGFDDQRILYYLTREPAPIPDLSVPLVVERRNPVTLLQFYNRFHDTENCWQRGHSSLEGLRHHLQGWAALDNGHIVGYALGWSHSYEIRLSDIATAPTTNRALTTQALLTHIHRLRPEAHGLSINIADDDPSLIAYQTLGYTTHLRQFEMVMRLATTS